MANPLINSGDAVLVVYNRMQSSLLELLRCGLSNLRTLATCLWRTDQKAIAFLVKKLWTAQKQNKKYINTL